MPHKTKETYVQLFKEVRKALMDEFGNIGRDKTVFMDMELAAHAAIGEVFPEWTIRSCYFHFIRCIKDKAKETVQKSVRQSDTYKKWKGELYGKSFAQDLFYVYIFSLGVSSY